MQYYIERHARHEPQVWKQGDVQTSILWDDRKYKGSWEVMQLESVSLDKKLKKCVTNLMTQIADL